MPQLLVELFSEEIPARMQAQAARDFERMARERLAAEGLLPEALKTFAGPRRLTLVAEGLPAAQGDRHLQGTAQALNFHDGYFDQSAALWSDGGRLLASAHQMVYFRD